MRSSEKTNDRAASPAGDLDRTDAAIIRILSVEARIPVAELAQRVGLSRTPVLSRLRRLEAEGYVTGYRAQLSASKLGLEHVAFVEARLSDTREAALSAFNRAVQKIPEVEECHMIAGGFDYLLKVRTRDIRDYRRVLSEAISTLPNVASTSTYVALESVKDSGVSALS